MNKKTSGIVLVILGVVMIAFDLLAAPLGLASAGFGWKQITLMIMGIFALGIGLFLNFSKGK